MNVPETMARLPRGRQGMPVPRIVAWSSERWAAIRHDPLVDRPAVFTDGREGRGRPVFGVMNEVRQRRAVMARLCGVCFAELGDGGWWLPNYPKLLLGTATVGGDEYPMTTEPPCCEPCATWAITGCPGISATATGLLRIESTLNVLQLVDPSRGPAVHDVRFDRGDDPAERERLGRIARRHGGAVGYVKLVLVAATSVDPASSQV
jgi:hypothetical protein